MPSYQFNNFTGRLTETKHLQPLYPISAARLETSEPPAMIWDSIKTKPVAASNVRAASSGSLPPKMIKLFGEMQKDMEAPVFLIRGTRDKVLFGVTCALMTVCAGMTANFLYRRTMPPQP